MILPLINKREKLSTDFYDIHIAPYKGIIIKICKAYTDSNEDFEDYYQEVCLQLWKSKNNFKGKAARSTWVYRLCLNVCLTLHKKNKMEISPLENKDYRKVENEDSIEDREKDINQLYLAIKQLKEIDRAVILLYLEQKSYQEIAAILGTTSSNIGVRINRIKKRLKNILHGKVN